MEEDLQISVIIPCRNAEKYILDCLRSVNGQTLDPVEVIVVDDASADRSVELIRQIHPEVILLREGGRGGAAARNAGMRATRGDWLAFLDADDIWYPDHLSRAAALIRKEDAIGYINHYDHLSLDGKALTPKATTIASLTVGDDLDGFIAFYEKYGHFSGMSACLVNRQRALEVGGFDERQIRRHDIEFWLRVVRGKRWVFDPVPTSAYRRNTPNSISSEKASCEIFRLRAFLHRKDDVRDDAAYRRLMSQLARKAIRASMRNGSRPDQIEALKLGYEYLHLKEKMFYFPSKLFIGQAKDR